MLEVYWASAKIGAVVVPLSPLLRGRGLSTLLRDADVGLVVTEEAAAPFLDEVRPDVEALRADRTLLIDGDARPGYCSYRALVDAADDGAHAVSVRGDDPTTSFTAVAPPDSRRGSSSRNGSARSTGSFSASRGGWDRRASRCIQARSASTAPS